ncbi:putative transcription factor C2H2 family [Helianthus annuus]|nr:putative transcription factor C2H2 family [Helianthus annuus]
MQGQNNAVGSLPESLTLEHGSSSSDSAVVSFIRNSPVDANQETRNLSMWNTGESSSTSVPNAWSSFIKAQHERSANRLSLGDLNMNPTHTHANSGHHGHNVTVNSSTRIGKTPLTHASGSSSGPVEMEAQQLSRKRKAAELSIGQSSSSAIESSNIYQRSGGTDGVWQSVSENPTPTNIISFDPIIPRLGSNIGGVSSDYRSIENVRRNVRIRTNNSHQQDQLPANSSSSSNNNNGLLSFSSPHPSLGLNLVAAGDSSSSHAGQPMLRVPPLTRNSTSLRANRPIASNIIGGSRDTSRTTPANIADHPLFVQLNDIRNTAQTAVNLDLNSVGGHETNNRASSLYSSRRRTELLRRSLLSSIDSRASSSGGQNRNLFSRIPPPVSASASASASQETGIPTVNAIAGHHLHRARTLNRQVDGAFGFPYLSSTTVSGGSERRGRLVSEMRNVLDRIRRGEGLRFEDVMLLDQSVFYGMVDIHDRHRDMRLDIDNMSYEELLALEERIGNVNTGLTEENIYKHLKQKTYASVAGETDAEPCCICQEEYKNGDDLGALGCGHEFHTGCIKQWLLQKNACPVCKSAASK